MAELLIEYCQEGKFPAQSCHPYNRPQAKLTLDLTHGEIPPKLSQHVTGQVWRPEIQDLSLLRKLARRSHTRVAL
jgi:hypothetical protein